MFIADLHIHSKYSRATSKDLDLEHLSLWARRKGIQVVGTGDFTHPAWFAELQEKLEPAEDGLFKLKDEHHQELQLEKALRSDQNDVRFMLTVEISNIYKKNDKVRKIHNVVCVPTFDAASKLRQELGKIGNINADGRPILGLDARDLLEIVLETSPYSYLIPAHIWTPWFSLFGSRSGFDAIEECFEDLTEHIFALETGLSSDPAMNWRLSALDRYTLVSNSDAHSPSKLGREANLLDTDLSYHAIFEAIKSRDPKKFLGTIEFFPEEGKYHFDGHRLCKTRFSPSESLKYNNICPVCNKPLTIGVMHRVEQLADRPEGTVLENMPGYSSMVTLENVLSEVLGVGPKSKRVQRNYHNLLGLLGPELRILRELPLEDIKKSGIPMLDEAIRRVRTGELQVLPGYDGEYGTVKLFEDNEAPDAQQSLFAVPGNAPAEGKQNKRKKPKVSVAQMSLFGAPPPQETEEEPEEDEAIPPDMPTEVQLSFFGEPKIIPLYTEEELQIVQENAAVYEAVRARVAKERAEQEERAKNGGKAETQKEATPATEPKKTNQENKPKAANRSATPVPRTTKPKAPAKRIKSPKKLLAQLNTEQQTAVLHWGSPQVIVAGPGTGKTRTLTQRIAYLVSSKRLHPTHILALTFTNKAAREMEERISDLLGSAHGVTVATFHRFCLERLLDEEQGHRILGESERMLLLEEVMNNLGYKHTKAERRNILSRISQAKQMLLTPDDKEIQEQGHEFAIWYREYQYMLKREGYYDLEDLLFESVRILRENENLRLQFQMRFQSIHVDEYQDLNAAQYQLLRLLVAKETDLCVIGDPDQAIYRFRGSDVRYFQRFVEDFSTPEKPAQRCTLWRNYRSPSVVLDAAYKLISTIPAPRRIPLEPTFEGPKHIESHVLQSDRAEAEFIIKTIETLMGGTSYFSLDSQRVDSTEITEEVSFSDFAILYRTGSQLSSLQEAFERSGIPFQAAQPGGLVDLPDTQLVLGILRFLASPDGDWFAMKTILQKWPHIGPKLQQRITSYHHSHEFKPEALLEKVISTFAFNIKQKAALETLYDILVTLRKATKKTFVSQKSSAVGTLDLLYEKLLNTQYVDVLALPRTEHKEVLYQRAEAARDTQQFLQGLLIEQDPNPYLAQVERVSLLTTHASKGLEFPIVFLVGCEDGLFPWRLAFDDPQQIEEECRLFYVGLTRAQKTLYITRAKHRQLFGKRTELPPSRFLKPISGLLKESVHEYKPPTSNNLDAQQEVDSKQQELFS